jgi:hypothetical protein
MVGTDGMIFTFRNHVQAILLLSIFSLSCKNEKLATFEDFFDLEHTIYLDPSVQMSSITSLNFNDKGTMLITDRQGKGVYLFNEKGILTKRLSSEKCHPGFNWTPVSSHFNPRGGILVMMGNMQAFWFTDQGECLTVTKPNIRSTSANFTFDQKGFFYQVKRSIQNTYIEVFDSLAVNSHTYVIDSKFPKLTAHFNSAIISYNKEGNLEITLPFEKRIQSYDTKGAFVKDYPIMTSFYKSLNQDTDQSSRASLFDVSDKFSHTLRHFQIGNNFIVCFINSFNTKNKPNEELGISFFKKDNPKSNITVLTNRKGWFIGSNNKQLYSAFIPALSKDKKCKDCGSQSSVGLKVYRFKEDWDWD